MTAQDTSFHRTCLRIVPEKQQAGSRLYISLYSGVVIFIQDCLSPCIVSSLLGQFKYAAVRHSMLCM